MACGAMTVTFLPAMPTVLGIRNGVQVMLDSQPIRSPISVSGFMFSFRIALPAGSFLQELNSFSPGYSTMPVVPVVAPAVVPAGAAAAGAGAAAAGGAVGAGDAALGASFHLRDSGDF